MTDKLFQKTKVIFLSLLKQFQRVWWIEIVTVNPCRIYYFGLFISANKAKFDRPRYLEQVKQGSTKVIAVTVQKCRPVKQSVDEDELLESLERRFSKKS